MVNASVFCVLFKRGFSRLTESFSPRDFSIFLVCSSLGVRLPCSILASVDARSESFWASSCCVMPSSSLFRLMSVWKFSVRSSTVSSRWKAWVGACFSWMMFPYFEQSVQTRMMTPSTFALTRLVSFPQSSHALIVGGGGDVD